MKSRLLFFFILTCILFSFPLAGGGVECASPSAAVSGKKDAEREDSVMRTTRLESGVVIVENLKYPHKNLDLIMKNHFLSCCFEPDNSLMISVGRNTGQENFSFSIYKNNGRSFCKYWFTLGYFSVLDYDGDGLADVRQKGPLPEYEIRLNDEWVSCRKIRLKDYSAVVSNGSVYKFERGKWQKEYPSAVGTK